MSGWGLYVAGRFNVERIGVTPSSDPTDLREDVKFTELVAAMLSSLRQMRLLEHRHATLSQFFSPVVLDTLAVEDPEVVLGPARDRGLGAVLRPARLLARVGAAGRRSAGAVAAGEQGLGRDDPIHPRARRRGGRFPGRRRHGLLGLAAAAKRRRAAHLPRGLGRARRVRGHRRLSRRHRRGHRPAVAGKIGTVDQVKVTVFGPVVNLASRLEGMTKILRAPILLDEATARIVRKQVPRDVARVRRLAIVRPYGLDTPLEVSELLPPVSQYPELTDEHLEYYEAALDAFLSRKWAAAFELLHRIPAEDQVKDFLIVYIAQHNRRPPPDWDGVIPLESK